VRDYGSNDGEVSRLRGWDSCQSATFYKLAGGHNPRPTKAARLRQRFYHKLLYIPDRFEIKGCVGCGRCVVSCPVNVDIREAITKVVEHQEKASVESVSA
jgi:ferredoxin